MCDMRSVGYCVKDRKVLSFMCPFCTYITKQYITDDLTSNIHISFFSYKKTTDNLN